MDLSGAGRLCLDRHSQGSELGREGEASFTGGSCGHWPPVADLLYLMDRHDLLMKGLSVGGNKQ